MHLLTADVVRAVLGSTDRDCKPEKPTANARGAPGESLAAADAWTMVSVLAAEPTKSNAIGMGPIPMADTYSC
jgi:hypothetical protein